MIIEEIRLNNFMSYYGKHVLQLEKGINYITGHCGSGRTNLAKALLFAVLGSREFKREDIVNVFHMKECREAGKEVSCEAEATLKIDAKTYVCRNKLSINEKDQIEQHASLPLAVDRFISPGNYELIYIDGLSLSEQADRKRKPRSAPLCAGIWKALLERLASNMEADIKMAILDQTFTHFTSEYRRKAHEYLAEFPMEQLIIIQSEAPELESGYRLLHVGEYTDETKIASKIDLSLTFDKKPS